MVSLNPQLHPPRQARVAGAGMVGGIARCLLLTLAVLYLLCYVCVAGLRMVYPYELEWMEGGIVDHVRWILAGHPLYGPPSLEFTPNIYTPLYFYLGAAVCKIVGVGFLPLRLISFASSLGCLGLIGRLVRRETGSWTWAIVSAGLFAAAYRASGAWMDIARVDSLSLLLTLAAIDLLRFRRGAGWLGLAGLVMGLSFLAKQSALFIAMPLILYTVLADKGWSRVAFGASFLGFVLATTLACDAATDGWYRYYVFDLPRQHRLLPIMGFGFWWMDIGKNLAVALALTILAVALLPQTRSRRQAGFYALMLVGMVGSSWMARLHIGGYDNVLMPAAAVLSIGLSLGACSLLSALDLSNRPTDKAVAVHLALTAGLYGVAIWQLLVLGYIPDQQVPHKRDRRGGDAMIRTLASLDGDIFIPEHGYLHTLAGRNTFHAHLSAVWDIVQGEDGQIARQLQEREREAITSRRYDVLILDEEQPSEAEYMRRMAAKIGLEPRLIAGPSWLVRFRDEIEANYRCVGKLFDRDDVFWPVTGRAVRPSWIYIRKDGPPAAPAASASQTAPRAGAG